MYVYFTEGGFGLEYQKGFIYQLVEGYGLFQGTKFFPFPPLGCHSAIFCDLLHQPVHDVQFPEPFIRCSTACFMSACHFHGQQVEPANQGGKRTYNILEQLIHNMPHCHELVLAPKSMIPLSDLFLELA